MTRIIAGIARGRRLAVPPTGTRPTSDRAREAMFNTLRAHLDIETAHVLDLFAGSGAVGLEALSRGATSVQLIESAAAACAVIRHNIDAVGLPGATLHRCSAAAYLERDAATDAHGQAGFDLVFADPPYSLDETELAALLSALVRSGRLADAALVVVERSSRGAEPTWPPGVDLVTHKRYGEGVLWYGRAHHEQRADSAGGLSGLL